MLALVAHDLCWINSGADDPQDQCAHGKVEFGVDGVKLITPEAGEWTLSAAGLYLLRTLVDDHTPEHSVTESNFLFPCCGFSTWLCGNRYKVRCMGCDTGIDVAVRHVGSSVQLATKEHRLVVTAPEWRVAVLRFTEQIEQFYARCTPKAPMDDAYDRDGWAAFWIEWRERRERSRHVDA